MHTYTVPTREYLHVPMVHRWDGSAANFRFSRLTTCATAALDASHVGIMSMVAINADFRKPSAPTFALQSVRDPTCTTFSDADAFVDALEALCAAGSTLLTYNGTKYIFPKGCLLDAVDPTRQESVKQLALGAVDLMVCFFVDNGFLTPRRGMAVATPGGGSRFPCDGVAKYDHQSVLTDICRLHEHLTANAGITWLPKKSRAGKPASKKARRSTRTWVPCSWPKLLTVREGIDLWDLSIEPVAAYISKPLKLRGDVVPAELLPGAK